MPKTFVELNQEIEALQAEAAATFETEVVEVVVRIRQAIDVYKLTAEDLGFGRDGRVKAASNGAANGASHGSSAKKFTASGRAQVKYRDDAGNTWSGRGTRPRWLKAALDAGQPIENFTVSVGNAGASTPTNGSTPARSSKRPALAAKYKDDAGHTWSGRGPRPRWFRRPLLAASRRSRWRRSCGGPRWARFDHPLEGIAQSSRRAQPGSRVGR